MKSFRGMIVSLGVVFAAQYAAADIFLTPGESVILQDGQRVVCGGGANQPPPRDEKVCYFSFSRSNFGGYSISVSTATPDGRFADLYNKKSEGNAQDLVDASRILDSALRAGQCVSANKREYCDVSYQGSRRDKVILTMGAQKFEAHSSWYNRFQEVFFTLRMHGYCN